MNTSSQRKGVSLRLPAELKAWLDIRADDNGRSINSEIIQLIKAQQRKESGNRKGQVNEH